MVNEGIAVEGFVEEFIVDNDIDNYWFRPLIPNVEYLLPEPISVIYNPPATVIMFDDGSKSVAKCHPADEFDAIIGFNSAFTKRFISTKDRGKLIDNAEWQGLTDKTE